MFRGYANSWTVDDLQKDVLRTSGTIHGQTVEVTALPVASSRQAGAHLVAVPTTCY